MQRARLVGPSPRLSHHEETSLNFPFDRDTPPSFDSMNSNGAPGTVTRKCWSGWSAFGWIGSVASIVMSVADMPASVESTTPRAFEIPPASL